MYDRVISRGGRIVLDLPERPLRMLAGPERRNDRGDVFDLQSQAMLRISEMLRFPPTWQQEPAEARAASRRNASLVDPRPPAVARVESRFCQGPDGPIPMRVYYPRETDGPLPVLVYLHGGGFVVGGLVTHDGVCRALARTADCIVVSVDYRLAPEHRFPAATEDAVAAFRWVRDNAEALGGDPARVGIGGDSSGGNLAAVTCLCLRDAGERLPVHQALIYPATDMTRSMESHRLFAHGYYLDAPSIDYFLGHYLRSEDDQRSFRASPLFAERFDALPPALVVTTGFDPLRDEGEAYAQKLRDAGVAVHEHREPTLAHGFVNMAVLRHAADAREVIGRALHAALRKSP